MSWLNQGRQSRALPRGTHALISGQIKLQIALPTHAWLLRQVSLLINELAKSGEAELGIELDGGVLERLLAYSRSVADFPTAVKEVMRSLSMLYTTHLACIGTWLNNPVVNPWQGIPAL